MRNFWKSLIKCSVEKRAIEGKSCVICSRSLRKEMMRLSFLEKVYFKNLLKVFKKPKNLCSRLYKKERKYFVNSLKKEC